MGSQRYHDSDIWGSSSDTSKFTDEELAELKECFVLFDRTGSGFIDGEDFGRALRALGQNPSEKEVTLMLQAANRDSLGRLSAKDYLQVIGQFGLRKEAEMHKELSEAFRVFDRNDIGSISAEELRNALKMYGECLEDDDFQKMMKLTSVCNNGSVDYLELTSKMISK